MLYVIISINKSDWKKIRQILILERKDTVEYVVRNISGSWRSFKSSNCCKVFKIEHCTKLIFFVIALELMLTFKMCGVGRKRKSPKLWPYSVCGGNHFPHANRVSLITSKFATTCIWFSTVLWGYSTVLIFVCIQHWKYSAVWCRLMYRGRKF